MAWAACPCRLDHRAIQEPSAQVVDYQRFYSKAVHGPHGQPILEAAAPHGPRAVPACSTWKRARRGVNPNPLVPSQALRPETGRGPLPTDRAPSRRAARGSEQDAVEIPTPSCQAKCCDRRPVAAHLNLVPQASRRRVHRASHPYRNWRRDAARTRSPDSESGPRYGGAGARSHYASHLELAACRSREIDRDPLKACFLETTPDLQPGLKLAAK